MKKYMVIISLLLTTQVFPSVERNKRLKIIKKIEQSYQSLIKRENLSADKRFLIYLDAARELYSYYFYKKADQYLDHALRLKTHHDFTNVYSLKTSIYRTYNPLKLQEIYKSWVAYNLTYPTIAKIQKENLEFIYLLNKFDKKKMKANQKRILLQSQLANI